LISEDCIAVVMFSLLLTMPYLLERRALMLVLDRQNTLSAHHFWSITQKVPTFLPILLLLVELVPGCTSRFFPSRH
jgi:hypothetical protein